ncbi:MAG: hypothetical protein CSA33_03315 [Desulfobulbus propionicus]|nr:MAG: hypothetical protein CSA33_03315 [Desulfobulbus propionicus]
MSSSKIFHNDSFFQPTNLVRKEIVPPWSSDDHEEPDTDTTEAKQETEACEEEPMPSPLDTVAPGQPPKPQEPMLSSPAPASDDHVPPEPAVDIEAVKEESYNQGAADARQHFQSRFAATVQALETACQKIDTLRTTLLIQCREEIINTAINLTQKIVDMELDTGRNLIAHTVEMAIEKAIESEEYIISLHPEDIQTIEEMLPGLLSRTSELQHIILKPDNTIERGGCLLDSKTCLVDATVAAQLEKAKKFLLEETPPLGQGLETDRDDR